MNMFKNHLMIRAGILVVALLATISMNMGFHVQAEGYPEMTQDTNNLTVQFVSTDGNKMNGAEIRVIRVADFETENGDITFTTEDVFKEIKINYTQMHTQDSIEVSKQIYEVVMKQKLASLKNTTDYTGSASFSQLENGMYLVYLEKDVKVGNKEYHFDPFLVQLPQGNVNQDGVVDGWNYIVTAHPKTQDMKDIPTGETPPPSIPPERPTTPNTPDNPPRRPRSPLTGDEGLTKFIAIFAGSIALLGFSALVLKEEKEAEE